ncbi:AgmX/PglI C-terminal domain-containing protein [bacterium]|nr:AgmX/PglI C-terminal domain-containing protein [FCB group bacterium]MBL7191802.1 AgmX/PglI C-terminal domain-containing protein [bacterium]
MDKKLYPRFPKELERHIFEEVDIRFWTIFIIGFVLMNIMVFYGQSLPVVENLEARQKLLKSLYKAESVTVDVTTADLMHLKEQQKKEEEEREREEIQEHVVEKRAERQLTADERKRIRAEKRQEQAQRAAELRQQATQNVGAMFEAAGARLEGRGIGKKTSQSGRTFKQQVAGSQIGVVTEGGSIAGSQRIIGSGSISEKAGGIQIVEGGRAVLEGGEGGGAIELEQVEEIRGEGAQNPMRSKETIDSILRAKMSSLMRCFERYKRNDPDLNGKISIRLTVEPNGTVSRVSISGNWSNPTLGTKVEETVRERVFRWKFDPIEKGSVSFELPVTFYK